MNTPTSNAENHAPSAISYSLFTLASRLKAAQDFSPAKFTRLWLAQLPLFLAPAAVIIWLGEMVVWQPLRKAMFTWREGMGFAYGDFALFFVIAVVLVVGLVMVLRRIYRRQSRIACLFNEGEIQQQVTVDAKTGYYRFIDAHGKEQRRRLSEDYRGQFPLLMRLFRYPSTLLGVDARVTQIAEAIACGNAQAYVVYHPAQPQHFLLAFGGDANLYHLRQAPRSITQPSSFPS